MYEAVGERSDSVCVKLAVGKLMRVRKSLQADLLIHKIERAGEDMCMYVCVCVRAELGWVGLMVK